MSAAVAMIGTGRMGAAMAVRLAGAGHRVTVHNRTRSRAEGLGLDVAATAAQAAAGADLVLVSLADDDAVRSTYHGDDGILAGLRPGAVVADTSTVHPDTVRELGDAVRARGGELLDAPVSGSVPLVQRGELTVLVGGSRAALAQVRGALEVLARQIFHLGGQGAGATMKLAVNAVVHGLNEALAEGLGLAERAGIDRAAAYDVLAASAVAAPFVLYKRDAYLRPAQTPVAFALDLVAKDLRLIDELARAVGAPMPQADVNRAVVARAVAAGLGERDLSAIAELLRRTDEVSRTTDG